MSSLFHSRSQSRFRVLITLFLTSESSLLHSSQWLCIETSG